MRIAMFVLSLLVLACSLVMLYGAIFHDSPSYFTSIIRMSLICGLSFIMARITYKELSD